MRKNKTRKNLVNNLLLWYFTHVQLLNKLNLLSSSLLFSWYLVRLILKTAHVRMLLVGLLSLLCTYSNHFNLVSINLSPKDLFGSLCKYCVYCLWWCDILFRNLLSFDLLLSKKIFQWCTRNPRAHCLHQRTAYWAAQLTKSAQNPHYCFQAGAKLYERRRHFRLVLPSIIMGNMSSITNKTDELVVLRYEREYRESSILLVTESNTTYPVYICQFPPSAGGQNCQEW